MGCVVGYIGPTPPTDIDRVDLGGFSVAVGGRDLFAVWRVDRTVVFLVIVGESCLTSPTDIYGVDLIVVSVRCRCSIGEPLAIRRVGRGLVIRIVVGYLRASVNRLATFYTWQLSE